MHWEKLTSCIVFLRRKLFLEIYAVMEEAMLSKCFYSALILALSLLFIPLTALAVMGSRRNLSQEPGTTFSQNGIHYSCPLVLSCRRGSL